MVHIILWYYFISLIISFASLHSTIMVFPHLKYRWIKTYIKLLTTLLLLLLSYTVFYFIFLYTDANSKPVLTAQVITLLTLTTLFLYSCLILAIEISEIKLKKVGNILLKLLLFICILFSFFAGFNWNNTIINISAGLYILLLLLATGIPVINIKKIFKDKSKRFLIILPILAIILVPVEFLEYFLIKWAVQNNTYLPPHLITFSTYCLLINLINMIRNIRVIYKIKSEDSIFKEIPDAFINEYSITEREKDVILLSVKGLNHKEISEKLFISTRTVNKHFYNIYKKCNSSNLIELLNIMKKYP